MFEEKLNKICEISESFGIKQNKGANKSEIVNFTKAVKKELDIDIPQQYIVFLKIINGFEFNGFIVYGIDTYLLDKCHIQSINGLIENNKIWHKNPWQKRYIFFGDSNISWYVYDLILLKYCELDKPSGNLINSYDSFEHMLNTVLEDAIV